MSKTAKEAKEDAETRLVVATVVLHAIISAGGAAVGSAQAAVVAADELLEALDKSKAPA